MDKDLGLEQRALERIKLELGNRHVLVLLHGLLLVEVGIAMVLFGTPDFFTEWYGGHARLIFGFGAIAPGATLILGSFISDEVRLGYYLQIFGLLGVITWEFAMAASYAVLAWTAGFDVIPLSDTTTINPSRPYVSLIYLNILSLATVHLVTLLRLGKPPR